MPESVVRDPQRSPQRSVQRSPDRIPIIDNGDDDVIPVNDFRGFRSAITSGSVITIGTIGEISSVSDFTNDTLITMTGTASVDAAVTGIGGLDTDSTTMDTWYYIHSIFDKSGTNPTDAIFSLTRTAPTLPSGYDRFRYIEPVRTSAANLFRPLIINGYGALLRCEWHESGAFVQLLGAGTATTPTVLNTSAFCPEGTDVYLFDGGLNSNSALDGLRVGPNITPLPDNLTRYIKPGITLGNPCFEHAEVSVNSVREIVYNVDTSSSPSTIISRGFLADRGL